MINQVDGRIEGCCCCCCCCWIEERRGYIYAGTEIFSIAAKRVFSSISDGSFRSMTIHSSKGDWRILCCETINTPRETLKIKISPSRSRLSHTREAVLNVRILVKQVINQSKR